MFEEFRKNYFLMILTVSGLISCGEVVKDGATGNATTTSEAPDEISQPEMVTGSFLTSCHWEESGVRLTCQMTPTKDGVTENMVADDFKAWVFDKKGQLKVSGFSESREVTEQGLIKIDINFQPPVALEDIQVQVNGKDESDTTVHAIVRAESIRDQAPAITLYSGRNYLGTEKTIEGTGLFEQQTDFPELSDSFASLRIPPGFGVRLCERRSSGDEFCMDLYGDTKDLQVLANKVSSVTIYSSPPFATIFQHFGWKGRNQKIPLAGLFFDDLSIKNAVSAFHIPTAFSLSACTEEPVESPDSCVSYTEDTYSLPRQHNDNFGYFNFGVVQ